MKKTSKGVTVSRSAWRIRDLASNRKLPIEEREHLMGMETDLTACDYRSLAEMRHQIRVFMHFSEHAVRSAGLNPHQHQLMLALKGLPSHIRPSIGELAKQLQVRHHTTVELVNRLARGGYVRRDRGDKDRREVLVSLTFKGERVLNELSLHHRMELRNAGPTLLGALQCVIRRNEEFGFLREEGSNRPEQETRQACIMTRVRG